MIYLADHIDEGRLTAHGEAASPCRSMSPRSAARGVLSPPGGAHLTQQRTVALESRLRHLLAQDAADTVTDGARPDRELGGP
ncbi:hypothetical protein AB0J71_46725 [Nonomuraea sp. NPDC049637]